MASPPDTDNSVYRDYGLLDPGLLKLRARIGKDILPADIADIIDEHPDLVDDGIREYVLRGLRGQLKKKRGHKRTHLQRLRELYAQSLFDDLFPRLQARRERQHLKGIKKLRGAYSAAELAHYLIGKRLGGALGEELTREAVRNLLSSLKKRQNYE